MDTHFAAERLSTNRMRALPILAVIFIVQQGSYFLGLGAGTGDRPIQNVQMISWAALSTTMLILLITGGGWTYSRQAREVADDEGTRAHRDASLRLGFTASMITCILLFSVTMARDLDAQAAIHLILSVGIATALVRFAFLERRASKE